MVTHDSLLTHQALLVDEILPEEMALGRLKKLPKEASPPQHCTRVHKSLGTADADALEVASKALFSTEELRIKAEPRIAAEAKTTATVYAWSFDSAAGSQAQGLLDEKRRTFDGWAQTAAYETGLQAVLAKMNGQSGLQNMQNTDAVGGRRDGVGAKAAAAPPSPAAAPPAAAGPVRGTLYRLDGLQARPELNGCVVVVIAEVINFVVVRVIVIVIRSLSLLLSSSLSLSPSLSSSYSLSL